MYLIEDNKHMISKNKIKLIHALESKKYRKIEKLFVAEGHKLVEELLPSFRCAYIAAKKEWIEKHPVLIKELRTKHTEINEVNEDELCKASLLKAPQDILALFEIPEDSISPKKLISDQLCIALDNIQDPGNLGTIIRIADWFGIGHIFCSPDTADVFNPKTVQATMGALARVKIHYLPLMELLSSLEPDTNVYGTFLNGNNIYEQELSTNGLIIMGNEGNGISPAIENYVNKRLYIPNYPQGRSCVESLNVAVATSIVCAEFRRRSFRS